MKDPQLSGFFSSYKAGDILFKQGELGDTTCVIIEGFVKLFDETQEGPRLVGTFGPGEFFGEKALLKAHPQQRVFTAHVISPAIILKFRLKDIPQLQKVDPDFMLHIFQAAVTRLERSYHLIRVLRSPSNMERVIRSILFLSYSPHAQKNQDRAHLYVQDIEYLLQLDRILVEEYLDTLAHRGAIERDSQDRFSIKNEKLLLHTIALREFNEKAA